jgi:hypothetical protein
MNTRDLDIGTLEAIARLRCDPDFRKFCEVLLTRRKACAEDAIQLVEPVDIYRNQGRAMELGEITRLVDEIEGSMLARRSSGSKQ